MWSDTISTVFGVPGYTVELSDGISCLSDSLQQSMPHLQGWANQFAGLGKNPAFPGLTPGSHSHAVEWVLQGEGEVTLHWQAGRAGAGKLTIKINQ